MANASGTPSSEYRPWESCHYCTLQHFKTSQEFERHLRERHCSVEGGSLVCRYGYNGLCAALALDRSGGAGTDYEVHIRSHHVRCHPPQPWDVYSAAQNLPAALNDPGRPKASSFFTVTWGDSFVENAPISPSPYLPDITHSHFELYMKKIGKKYRKHSRIAAQYNADVVTLKMSRSPSMEYNLSEIPSIFFKNNLPLNNSDIFNQVFPGLGSSVDSRSSCRSLQERLSHYLDIVEVQIAKQVSQKSDAFFHAMLSHDTIMEQMSSAISVVKSLRCNIQQAKDGLTTSPLNLIKLATFRNNTNSVYDKLKLMSTVHQTQPMIQLLLSTADYVTALDLIGTTQSILSTQLCGIHAFRHLSSQLTEMERLIDKMLTTEFRRFVAEDFNRPWGDDFNRTLDEDKLISVVSGLLRRRRYEFVDICKEEAIATAQATIKQVMIEEATVQDGEVWIRGEGESGGWKGGTVGLLTTTTARLTLLLQRLLALRALVLGASVAPDVALADGEEFFTLQDQKTIEDKLQGLVNSMCDYCLERCSTLINGVEKDKGSATDGEGIVEMAQVVEDFTALCVKFTGKPCIILKNALKNRFSRYVQRFHNDRSNKLSLLLDNERWKKAEVPAEFQAIVDYISETGHFPKDPWGDRESEKATLSCLMIDGEAYSVVGVALLAMRMIGEYCGLGNGGMEDGGSGPTGKALGELLRLFNSRTSRRVLGAGALQSAGLKTITATNLALAWRALDLMKWLLRPVRWHFPLLETQWATLERDIGAHIGEIHAKLCSLAGALLGVQLSCWEARPPVPSQQLRAISRHLLKFHEALLPALPPSLLQSLFQSVHRNFKDKLRDQLSRMNVVANGGPQHGVVTSELTFYLQTLATLQVLPEEDLTLNSMNEIWSK